MDMEKVIENLTHLKERLKWQKDIQGYGIYIDFINGAIALLKEQEEAHKILVEMADEMYTMLKEQKWHLLTEDANGSIRGLPGDDGQYLMTDGKDIWIDDYLDGVADGVILDSGRDIREITAWMYMPELPKQKRR